MTSIISIFKRWNLNAPHHHFDTANKPEEYYIARDRRVPSQDEDGKTIPPTFLFAEDTNIEMFLEAKSDDYGYGHNGKSIIELAAFFFTYETARERALDTESAASLLWFAAQSSGTLGVHVFGMANPIAEEVDAAIATMRLEIHARLASEKTALAGVFDKLFDGATYGNQMVAVTGGEQSRLFNPNAETVDVLRAACWSLFGVLPAQIPGVAPGFYFPRDLLETEAVSHNMRTVFGFSWSMDTQKDLILA